MYREYCVKEQRGRKSSKRRLVLLSIRKDLLPSAAAPPSVFPLSLLWLTSFPRLQRFSADWRRRWRGGWAELSMEPGQTLCILPKPRAAGDPATWDEGSKFYRGSKRLWKQSGSGCVWFSVDTERRGLSEPLTQVRPPSLAPSCCCSDKQGSSQSTDLSGCRTGYSGRPRSGGMAVGGPYPVLHTSPWQRLRLGVMELGPTQGTPETVRAPPLDEWRGDSGGGSWRKGQRRQSEMFTPTLASPWDPCSRLPHLTLLLRLAPRGRRLRLPGAARVGGVQAGEACAQLRGRTPTVTPWNTPAENMCLQSLRRRPRSLWLVWWQLRPGYLSGLDQRQHPAAAGCLLLVGGK